MSEVRTSLVVLLAGLVGFALGAAMLGFAALSIGMSLLGHAQGGIHSDWTLAVLLATLIGIVSGSGRGQRSRPPRRILAWLEGTVPSTPKRWRLLICSASRRPLRVQAM